MNKNNKIFFSVIVPVYNTIDFFNKCIDSIIKQTFKNFELIIVDDGSSDGCSDICDDYAKLHSNVKVVHNENSGLVHSRNVGLKMASGEYVVYIDSDDWVKNNYLEESYKILRKFKSLDLLIFNFYSWKEEFVFKKFICKFNDVSSRGYVHKSFSSNSDVINLNNPLKNNLVPFRFIYNRSFLIKHYCINENIVRGEDWAFTHECVLYSKNIFIDDRIFYYYNNCSSNSLNKRSQFKLDDALVFFSYIS